MSAHDANNSRFEGLRGNQEPRQETPIKALPASKNQIGWLFWVAAAILGAVVAFHKSLGSDPFGGVESGGVAGIML